MKILDRILVGLLIVTIIAATAMFLVARPNGAIGSVPYANEYLATTTKRLTGASNLTNLQVLKTGQGSIGSVVITGANTGMMRFYDATSTRTNTEWATTTIAEFPASVAAGTYTIDGQFVKGLLIEISGTQPTSTITWR